MNGKLQLSCIVYPIFMILILTIMSCSSSTEVNKGTLSGTVQLEGETDHSGITIALYQLAELDPEIVEINLTYPQIGIQINQHTEFDHRLQSAVKSSLTSADGDFELKDISTGKYNLVAIKQGWGFRYLYEIQIDKGDNEVATAITLYPELHISGDWNSDITVDTYNHLVVDGNTNLVPGTSFTIMPGAVVRINPGCDFKIFGDFSAQGEEGNMFWVTSNDGFNQQAVTSNQRLNELELYFLMELANISFVEDNLIEWGKWDWGNTCLMNGVNNLNMENSIFQNGSCGFHSLNVDLTNCSNLLARNCWGDNVGGLYYSNINDGFINYSIAFKCTNGSRVKDNFRGSINNNCFISNNNGIELWDMLGVVSHNEFDNLSKDIKLTGSTSPQTTNMVIELNNLNGNIGVYQFSNYSYGYYTLIILSYNNFFNNNLFILHNSGFCNTGNEYIIANDNYFKDCYTLDQVFEKIVQEHPNCDNRVLIESFFHNMLSEAGIEG